MRRAREQPVAVSSRATRCALVAFVSLVIFAGGAAAASAACAQDVIDDWADNGIVDGTYPARCYENAIAELPEDLRSYSSAAEDISRALQRLLVADAAPRADSGSAAPSAEGTDSGEEGPSEEPDEGDGDEAAVSPAESEPPPPDEPPVASDDAVASAAGAGLGDGGDTLPLPVILLLVLVGVAIATALGILGLRGLKERRAGRE